MRYRQIISVLMSSVLLVGFPRCLFAQDLNELTEAETAFNDPAVSADIAVSDDEGLLDDSDISLLEDIDDQLGDFGDEWFGDDAGDISGDLTWDEADLFAESDDPDALENVEEIQTEYLEESTEAELIEELTDELFASGEDAGDDLNAENIYSYEIYPMLMPFNNLYYVRTDDPDPTSFRFVDKSSRFMTEDNNGDSGMCDLLESIYQDVVYEDEASFRVKGGYIFKNYQCDIDGGDLILQRKSKGAYGRINWDDTGVTVSCPSVVNMVQYLLDQYTDDSMSFFEKLGAVEGALYEWALYPRGVSDSTKPRSFPYPCLASSPYEEMSLNPHYDVYQRSSKQSLVTNLYPFILDSLSFPGTITAAARILEPGCTIEMGEVHWLRKITLNGESHYYGWAGAGTSDPIYANQLTEMFRFDNSADDLYKNASLDSLKKIYLNYGKIAGENVAEFEEQLTGDTYVNEIGPGCWIRIAVEGSGQTTYSYAAHGNCYNEKHPHISSDAWVDGKYVNSWERIEIGASFAEHPEADIILRNVSYTDYRGNAHTNDIVYQYDSETDTWRASSYYGTSRNLPDLFILTREQVEQMNIDGSSKAVPISGKIYDGTAFPGTPFGNTLVTGIRLPEKMTIDAGEHVALPVTFEPEDATDRYLNLTTDSTDVLFGGSGDEAYLFGYKPGTATVTAVSYDGGFGASCEVTVVARDAMVKEGEELYAYTIEYGQPVSRSFSDGNKNRFVDKKTGERVYGAFAYDDPNTVPEPGTYKVPWTFTPISEAYNILTGTLEVLVRKLTPSLLYYYDVPKAESGIYSESQTLKDVKITGGKTDVEGTWAWTNPDEVPQPGWNTYSCTFYPKDEAHYNTLTEDVYVYMREVHETELKPGTALKISEIEYGQPLSDAYMTEGTFIDKKDTETVVYGGLTFEDPDQILEPGTHQVKWIFTPYNDSHFSCSGTGSVTVLKVSTYLLSYYDYPTAENGTYDEKKTLKDVKINGGKMNVNGTWAWTNPDEVPEPGGYYYSCTFYPEDAAHYSTYETDVYLYMAPKDGRDPGGYGYSDRYSDGVSDRDSDGYSAGDSGSDDTGDDSWDQEDDEDDEDTLGTDGTAFGRGASVYAMEKALLGRKDDSDPAGAQYALLKLKSKSQGTNNIKISWSKVPGASAYVIYGNKCGKGNSMKYLGYSAGTSANITAIQGKKLKAGTYYKFFAAALDENDHIITSSRYIHVATKGGKVTNVSRVKAQNKRISLKIGKTGRLKIKTKKQSNGKLKTHRKITYESTDTGIASVDSKGKVKAIKAGTCYILAYAQNGVGVKIKVNVN